MSIDLKNARILVTNDDGVEAEGIAILERIARALSDDVWIVAPDSERSGAGHSLTMSSPLRYRQLGPRRFEVLGTPTDSVLMAVTEIIEGKKPDLVLSGINRGANVAEDVTYSGTIAAAMEATLLEIPAIALSNHFPSRDHKLSPKREGLAHFPADETGSAWHAAEHFAERIIRKLVQVRWPHGSLVNVNFPGCPVEEVKGVNICPQGRRKIGDKLWKRTDPRGRAYYWIAGPGTEPFEDHPEADYRQLADGYITITPLDMDLTDYAMLDEIRVLMGDA